MPPRHSLKNMDIEEMNGFLQHKKYPESCTTAQRQQDFRNEAKNFTFRGGSLLYKKMTSGSTSTSVVFDEEDKEIMRKKFLEVHESSGHPRIGKMQKRLAHQCYNILNTIIEEVVKGCQFEGAVPLKTTSQMVHITVDRPFQQVQIVHKQL